MPSIPRTGRTIAVAAAAALLLATAPSALAATSTIFGSISPNKGPIGSPFTLKLGFTITPSTEGEQPTLNRVTLNFPALARPNGGIFPVCTERAIDAKRGRFTDCPAGSRIGSGRVLADVPNVPVFNVPATLTIFNGGANKVTIHVYATNPVLISEAITGNITRSGGRYKVDFVLPENLQEINDGWFAVEKRITSTIGATRMIRGRRRGYLESTTLCPRALRVPIAGTFAFRPGTAPGPTSAEGTIACRR